MSLFVLRIMCLLVFSGGVYVWQLKPGVDLGLFLAVLTAAALTGNGVYALNAYYDLEAGKINKPNRPCLNGLGYWLKDRRPKRG